MYPHPNPLRARLAADCVIAGLYIQTASPDNVEIAAQTGYDYVIIDQEHGSFDLSATLQMIRAAEATGITPFVRVPDHTRSYIRRVLEAGALGVYVPDVRTAEQAREAVAAAKYGDADNGGTRGACPTSRATQGRGGDWRSFVEWSNQNVMVSLLIESKEGFDNLDAILAVPGIDAVVLGRFDLAHELGLNGDRYGEHLNGMFEVYAAKARAAGVTYIARLKPSDPVSARAEFAALHAAGARVFNLGSDREFIARTFRNELAPLR